MELTSELKTAIRNAKVYLETHNNLSLPPRLAILRAFGEKNDEKAHKRRTNLAILCVEKVLPLWNQEYEGNNLPQEFIELAKQVINGQVAKESAKEKVNLDWVKLEDMERDNYAHSAGFAAISTIYVATSDEMWLEVDDEWEEIEENNYGDEDFDPYMWTVSYHASLAYGEEEIKKNQRILGVVSR